MFSFIFKDVELILRCLVIVE